MKKVFFLVSILIVLSGCGEKNIKLINYDKEKIDFICKINENNILHCDNEISNYNEFGNLISITSKNNPSDSYNYLYNDAGFITSMEQKDGTQIFITYKDNDNDNDNDNIDSIQYIMNPSGEGIQKTVITYKFLYNDDNKIKQIFKYYNYNDINDIDIYDTITYEYYNEKNIDYVKEIKIIGEKKITRIFKLKNIGVNEEIFNFKILFNNIYYRNLGYYPTYNFSSVNYGYATDVPLFISNINSIEITNFGGDIIEKINYYSDSNGRFITDSKNSIINNFVENDQNNLIRYTIYNITLDIPPLSSTIYYKYKTEYIYENNKIVKFIKYKENEISKTEYDKLKNEYLKVIKTK